MNALADHASASETVDGRDPDLTDTFVVGNTALTRAMTRCLDVAGSHYLVEFLRQREQSASARVGEGRSGVPYRDRSGR